MVKLILKKDLFKHKKPIQSTKKKEINAIKANKKTVPTSDDVEVLDLYPGEQGGLVKDVSDDSLNLDELFKTISMEKIYDDKDFDFNLKKDKK